MNTTVTDAEAPTMVIRCGNQLDVWAQIARHIGAGGAHQAFQRPAGARRPETSYVPRHAAPEDGAR
ncbi:MAG TPA: hypothetical protein VFW64_12415 [Pseudonocardiaceae bacterium]|nr:hypothetical protein [Pseudonocardiaceae bacterium]